MNDVITIKDVRAYIDNSGTARLSLEDCARGLGFTTVAKSGNEVVRWARVREYLAGFGYSVPKTMETFSAETFFIPENIFYRLAMKANNKVAEEFQTVVCDEILPTIRKTGSYTNKPMTQIELIAETAKALLEQEKRLGGVEKEVDRIKNDLPLFNVDCKEIQSVVRKTGINCLGGIDSAAYKDASIRGKVYSDIQRQLKREFNVCTYAAIKHSQIKIAVKIANEYKLPYSLSCEISMKNYGRIGL
jgi:prophage antirepressor-like protein